MYRWCRGTLTALVVATVQQAPALASSQAKGDLEARLQDLKEQYESRLRHSPAALARQRARSVAQGAAGDFIVNNDGFVGASNQSQIVVRRQPGGGTVAVWTDDRDGNSSIYGQVFDSLGAPIGENFRLHPDPRNLVQQDPDIAVRPDGGFYGAFTQFDDSGDVDVVVHRFSKLGQRLGAGVSVAPDSSGATTLVQRRPRLTLFSDSTILVAYERDHKTQLNSNISVQRMTINGTARLGARLDVSADLVVGATTVIYDEREPELARSQGDTVWVTWTDNRDGGVRDVFCQRLRRVSPTTLALVGNIFKANDEPIASNASQKTPQVAVASDGSALITWADFRNSNWDIYKQSFTRLAAKVGANARVNFTDATSLDQTEPSVTWFDTLGILAWKDFRSGVARVYAQKYRSDGSAAASNFQVGSSVSVNQSAPDISVTPAGDYSVGWTQPESGFATAYYRLFTAADAGSASLAVAEIVISAQQIRPATSVSAAGDLFTVWEESRAALPNIVGQALTSTLVKPQSDEQVNDGPAVLHLVPTTAVGGSTGFVVWEDYRDTLQPVYSDIYLRQYTLTATGYTPTGSNVRVIDTAESQEVRLASWNPEVAADAFGNALVVWQDNRLGSWDIFATRYSPTVASGTGNPQRVGQNYRLDQAPDFTMQIHPKVDVNDAGQTVVVWEDTRAGSYDFSVWARMLTGTGGAFAGGEVHLAIDSTLLPRLPDVAVAPGGGFAVVFEDHSDPADVDVYLQRFDAAGNRIAGALGDPVKLNDDGPGAFQYNVRVAAISGGYVAVWQDERTGDWDIRAARVPDGLSAANASYLVNDVDGSDQTSPSIAARRSENNPFICWEDVRVSATAPDVFGNRNPAAVASSVDNDARGVLPTGIALDQNYPNPFNPATEIAFSLGVPSKVDLVVYNTLGQKVKTLYSGPQVAGAHKLSWNGTDDRGGKVASGTYFYRLSWDDGEVTRKMTLLR